MKYWIIALVALLLGSNAFWMFALLDDAVTCMYSDASYDITNQMYRQSLALSNLNLVGLSVDEAKVLIGKDIHGFEPFEKEGCLNVGQICLQVSNSRTIEVIRELYP
jgi:hypothetical protein